MRRFSFSLSFFLALSVAVGSVSMASNAQSSPAPKAQPAAASAPDKLAKPTNVPASSASATTTSGQIEPTPAEVMKLLRVMRVHDDLTATLDTMKQEMQRQAEAIFRDKIPNPSPEQLKSVHAIVDDSFAELSLDDLIHDLVPIYQRHLSQSDVRALLAFYSSPPGQKILREQPAIIRESMQVAGNAQQKRMEKMLAKVELRMQQLIEQEQSKAEPEKK